MKSRVIRFVSFVTAIILTITAFPLLSSATSFNKIVNAATEIIMTNEGNYTTVVRNDNGSLSIGKICWHGTNALNLLKEIVAKNPSQALNILGSSLYNEIITSYYWETKIPTNAEASVIAVLLATAESRQVQDETAWEYISDYVDHGMALGITEPEALVFFADFENQNGRAGAASFYYEVRNIYGTVNLGTLYAASSKNNRRTRTYNFCASIDWIKFSDSPSYNKDTVAPQIGNVVVSNITSTGYTVSCTTSDNIDVASVYFAVFHQNDGSNKAKWYKTDSTDTASMTIDIAEFGNRTGNYHTYIYAFDASGNYAYVELNIINVPEAPPPAVPTLSVTVSATSDGKVGGMIRWKASTTDGSGSYLYSFDLYKDGKQIAKRNKNDFNDFQYEVKETGIYTVVVTVYDTVNGTTASTTSAETNIFEPIIINSINANFKTAIPGQSVIWTVDATGGEGDLKYSYTLYRDDTIIYRTDYASGDNRFSANLMENGVYSVTVNIMDSRSQIASVKSENVPVRSPLSAKNVSFSSAYAVAGKTTSCSVDIQGGSGNYTCNFSIYCDGELVLKSGDSDSNEFTFTIPKGGNYTATVTVTDADSTVTEASGGNLTVFDKPIKGDSNCDGNLDAADARHTLRCAAQLEPVDEAFMYAIDVDEDGDVTAADARIILRVSAQLDTL